MNKADILGRWHILRWEQRYDDGRVVQPMGAQPQGFIQYDDGEMFCLLNRPGRNPFLSGGQWSASEVEKTRAYDTFMVYAGSYAIRDEEIHHHVRYSLFPNWVGGTQVRQARLQGGELWLSARIEHGTFEARTADLVWTRAGAF